MVIIVIKSSNIIIIISNRNIIIVFFMNMNSIIIIIIMMMKFFFMIIIIINSVMIISTIIITILPGSTTLFSNTFLIFQKWHPYNDLTRRGPNSRGTHPKGHNTLIPNRNNFIYNMMTMDMTILLNGRMFSD